MYHANPLASSVDDGTRKVWDIRMFSSLAAVPAATILALGCMCGRWRHESGTACGVSATECERGVFGVVAPAPIPHAKRRIGYCELGVRGAVEDEMWSDGQALSPVV